MLNIDALIADTYVDAGIYADADEASALATPGRAATAPVSSAVDFAADRLRILDKAKRLVPLVYNPVQADLMATLTGRDLVLKARQKGVSTAIQGYLYQQAVTGTATTLTLANDDDATAKLRRIFARFHLHDPQKPATGAANARLTTFPQTDSEVMIATAGNRTSGRAATLTHLHGSEVGFWPDAESIITGAGQAGNPHILLESTANGAQGYFYTLCMEALDGASDWRLHFYPWFIDAEYQLPLAPGEALDYTPDEAALVTRHDLTAEQIKWRRAKQRELKHLFIQEYPEDPRTCFLQSGNGYFGDLSGVFTAPLNAEYQEGHRYVAGLDFGQTTDYTACPVFDADTKQQVDLVYVNRLPWQAMRALVVQACQRWHVAALWAEANSMGTTNIEALTSELNAAGCCTLVLPFDTTNDSKFALMANLHQALHEGGWKLLPDPVQQHELAAFQSSQTATGLWRLAAPERAGEHDDTVIGLGLAYHAALHGNGLWFG